MDRLRSSVGPAALATLVSLLAWGLAPVVYLVFESLASERSLSGADGPFTADQLQYLAWIRSAGEHVLATNGYDLRLGAHVFLHPMWLLSGAAWRAGVAIPVSYLLWVPIGAVVLFAGFRAYARRLLAPGRARVAALVLALFFVTPAHAIFGWLELPGAGSVGLFAGELSPALELWGYLPIVIALGLMPLFLLGIERILEPGRGAAGRSTRWWLAWTAVAGALASWLHPWQGETLLVVVAGLLVWRRDWRSLPRLGVPLVATLVPLLYYVALARWDSAWAIARTQTHVLRPSLLYLALDVAPLLLLALAAPRHPGADTQERMLWLWPLATAIVYAVSFNQGYGLHSVEGLSLPLGILAVRGGQRLKLPAVVGATAVLAATLPGLLFSADFEHRAIRSDQQPFLLRGDEARALAFLDHAPGAGGVLSSGRLAAAVPAYTGRRTWQGHLSWTPDFPTRAAEASDLFAGRLRSAAARELVRRVGARFLLADCAERRDLAPLLGPVLRAAHRFGCASVYELDVPAVPALL